MLQNLFIGSISLAGVFGSANPGRGQLFSSTRPSFKKSGSWIRGYWNEWTPSKHEERIVLDAASMAQLAYSRNVGSQTLEGSGKLSSVDMFDVHSSSYGFTGVVRASVNGVNYSKCLILIIKMFRSIF